MMDISSVNYDKIFRRYDILVEAKEKPEDIAAKILPKDALLKKVAEDVVFMKYKDIEADAKAALAKFKPRRVYREGTPEGNGCRRRAVRTGYLLPAARHGRRRRHGQGHQAREKSMKGDREMKGKVVMHVAEGDPHDIGKNIAAVMLKSNGYGVVDMGRDVPVDDVVADRLRRTSPDS